MLKAMIFFVVSFIVVLSLLIFLLLSFQRESTEKNIINPIVHTVAQQTKTIRSLFATGIDRVIMNSLHDTDGTYSVIVINMKTHEIYSQNPDRIYKSASLYKLWVMAAVYQQIEEGKLKKDDILKDSVENLNKSFNIASEEAELTKGEVSSTVTDALTKAITLSDNYSALLLTKKIGITTLNRFLRGQELYSSKTGTPPTTSAHDIALFYTKLYNHELVSPASSQEMIDLLKRQAINDRIPKYLPEEIDVAHKTGELDQFKHDAGIVFTPKGDYILVFLSQTDDPKNAAENMAKLSKEIYSHYMNLN